MSVLEDLIKKHCPDGVEYTNIGNIATVTKLAGFEFTKYVTYSDKGKIIALRGLNVKKGKLNLNEVKYIDESDLTKLTRSKLYIDDMLFTYVGTIGEVALIDKNDKYYLAPNVALIRFNKELIVSSFMKYYFQSNIFFNTQINKLLQSSSIKNIPMEKIRKFSVPLPPIEIQKEIVRILDTFTELTTELTLRKKQYEYYRDKLLTFGDDVEWKELKKVCTDFIVPMRDKPKIFNGNIPWCRIEDVEGKYFNTSLSGRFVSNEVIKEMNLKVFPIGTVICSCSASLGTYAINTQPLITNQTFIGIVCGDKLNNQYLRYYMETQTKKLISLSNAGTIPYISRQKFEDLKIPVPPLEEQERIVKILDRFDALCNDISSGLPAEIEMRKKQYEYYRDKLLTFKEKKI